MILITLWHQVERELVAFAARAGDEGRVIDGRRYRERVEQLRRGRGWNWKTINARLSLESCERYGAIEALRLVANSYKHDLSVEPSEELKEYLQLPEVDYAPLPESDLFRERFAAFVGLEVKAGYCEIAETLVGITGDFLKSVERRTRLSTVRWGPIPLDRFAH